MTRPAPVHHAVDDAASSGSLCLFCFRRQFLFCFLSAAHYQAISLLLRRALGASLMTIGAVTGKTLLALRRWRAMTCVSELSGSSVHLINYQDAASVLDRKRGEPDHLSRFGIDEAEKLLMFPGFEWPLRGCFNVTWRAPVHYVEDDAAIIGPLCDG